MKRIEKPIKKHEKKYVHIKKNFWKALGTGIVGVIIIFGALSYYLTSPNESFSFYNLYEHLSMGISIAGAIIFMIAVTTGVYQAWKTE